MTPTISPSDRSRPARASQAPMLASNTDRDAAAQRLQLAFAEHRLTDDEFDHRIKLALTARTCEELDGLTADLPAAAGVPGTSIERRTATRSGRLAVAVKGSVARIGQWRVPERLSCVVYKGNGRIDLSSAELTAAVTTIRAVAYKSTIKIQLPHDVRIEASGVGVSNDYAARGPGDPGPAPDAPLIRLRGVAYKGSIEVTGASGLSKLTL